ncbi:MAG: hypothetical protein FWG42_10695, partial [Clostridiales bacterium]|nr:hypothetical protein [Clostridiales bacterium]
MTHIIKLISGFQDTHKESRCFMANANELSYRQLVSALFDILPKMNKVQLGQFFTVSAARNIIYFSDDFFDHDDTFSCLIELFMSLRHIKAILFERHESMFGGPFPYSVIIDCDKNPFSHASVRDRDLAWSLSVLIDRALAIAQDFAIDLNIDAGVDLN